MNNSNEEKKHAEYAMQLATSSIIPLVLKAAIELGILETISKAGPGAMFSASQIATRISNPDSVLFLDRILGLLASHSILTCSDNQSDQLDTQILYGLAPVAKYFLPNQDGASLAPFLNLIQDKVMMDIWYHLKDAVVEGVLPFKKTYGTSVVEYVGRDSRFRGIFTGFTEQFNLMLMDEILKTYMGFDGVKVLVDVGGGNGSILNMIVSKYPAIKGINYDLPTIIQSSPSYPGIEHVAGDMFANIPKGDAIFMKWILHSLDDEHCIKLLTNCYDALPDNGKVIVVDMVIPNTPESSLTTKSINQLDLIMMNTNPLGKERTKRQFESLGKAVGFSHIQITAYAYNYTVIEFHKTICECKM